MRTASNTSYKESGTLATLFFTTAQIRAIRIDAGDLGYTLMTVYTAIAKQTSPNMEDATVAAMIGSTARAVRDTRLKLQKTGWFDRVKTTIHGVVNVTYHVGKQAVESSTQFTNTDCSFPSASTKKRTRCTETV